MELTTRDLWTVAWRHARRNMGERRQIHGEAALLDLAQRELGGLRLSLDWQCRAMDCWMDRRHRSLAKTCADARGKRMTKLFDLCRDRWAAEARAEVALASERIVFTEVPYTPRDARKFMRATGAAP